MGGDGLYHKVVQPSIKELDHERITVKRFRLELFKSLRSCSTAAKSIGF